MCSAPRNLARGRRGFTLVEIIVAMGVMSILLLGTGAAITMSVSAADRNSDPNTRFTAAADAADRMLADVQSATEVVERTSRAVTVKVPDRNGDNQPELIRYAWSGTGGGVLTRAMNSADAVVILSPVDALVLSPLLRAGQLTTDSAERQLSAYQTATATVIQTATVTGRTPIAQYLKPAFDANVTAWRISRVRLYLMRDATPTGTLRVSIVQAENWAPTGATLATLDLPEASLPSTIGWVDLALPTASIDPRRGVFIKLESTAPPVSSIAATTRYAQAAPAMPFNTYFTMSSDGGSAWTAPNDNRDLFFYAYGTVTTHD